MKKKVRPSTTASTVSYSWHRDGVLKRSDSFAWKTGAETIIYDEGPMRISGACNWKECEHNSQELYQPFIAECWCDEHFDYRIHDVYYNHVRADEQLLRLYPKPNLGFDTACVRSVIGQLDLNTNEAVLLYSGVVQALPFLGGVLRLNHILKEAARKFGRDLRRKPFTTAVKTLISADFIDRFVISPTLDDARRFQDAVDYTLRVISTAKERTAHRFALSSQSSTIVNSWEGTGSRTWLTGCPDFYVKAVRKSYSTSKAFMLLEAKYDLDAIDPLAIWAQRVGLTRPLDSVWDLVPFSFVIDYFTRAGDFISHLSDEMSSVDGLRGTITKIHDLWYTVENTTIAYQDVTRTVRRYNPWPENMHWNLSRAYKKSSSFVRKRVPDPWSYVSSLMRQKENYLTIDIDLSPTRKRTIAELIIQAKL